MPVKDKHKRDLKSHAPARGPAAQHEPLRDRRRPATAPQDDDEDLPRNRVLGKTDEDEAQPRSKRHHLDANEVLPANDAPEPAAKEAEEEELSDDIEPSPEELQAEEATVQAAVGMVPRDDDAGTPIKDRTSYDADTAIKLYLREIGQVKLLTPQEEIDLAAKIKRGDKKAREDMIKANLRLVVKIAHDYEGLGLPLLDLINEGNIGLMKAVERFDPAKGGKLSTYGSWWIKQSIKRALANQSKTIRLPVHLVDKISKMRRVSLQMSEELGREPTDDELGEEIGIDRKSTRLNSSH